MDDNRVANPTPFGLLGCSMAILMINLRNAGLFELRYIGFISILFGGIVQLIAGFLEYRNKNTFGFTTFSAYSIFWFSIVWYDNNSTKDFLAIYMLLWCIFTLMMFLCVLRSNLVLRFFFLGLTLLYFFSSLSNFLDSIILFKISSYIGIITGFIAFYLSLAILINNEYGKVILPIGEGKD